MQSRTRRPGSARAESKSDLLLYVSKLLEEKGGRMEVKGRGVRCGGILILEGGSTYLLRLWTPRSVEVILAAVVWKCLKWVLAN